MRYPLVIAAALVAFTGAAPAFAAIMPPTQEVPSSVILAGPNDTSDNAGTAQVQLTDYLRTVCPTVMAHPGEYGATFNGKLMQFCQELRS